jgi:hypothetical protein
MGKTYEGKFEATFEAFSDFNARNDDCDYCPFFEEECSGNSDKGCLCEDILKLLERGLKLEQQNNPDWRVQHG